MHKIKSNSEDKKVKCEPNLCQYKTLQACAAISVSKLYKFHLQHLVISVKNYSSVLYINT